LVASLKKPSWVADQHVSGVAAAHHGTGDDGRIRVIAVVPAEDPPGNRAIGVAALAIKEPVIVGVYVAERAGVAVVVAIVTGLGIAGVSAGIRVVAIIPPARDVSVPVSIAIRFRHRTDEAPGRSLVAHVGGRHARGASRVGTAALGVGTRSARGAPLGPIAEHSVDALGIRRTDSERCNRQSKQQRRER
jgi:hypothetical protein